MAHSVSVWETRVMANTDHSADPVMMNIESATDFALQSIGSVEERGFLSWEHSGLVETRNGGIHHR